jgi:hypothetical protein
MRSRLAAMQRPSRPLFGPEAATFDGRRTHRGGTPLRGRVRRADRRHSLGQRARPRTRAIGEIPLRTAAAARRHSALRPGTIASGLRSSESPGSAHARFPRRMRHASSAASEARTSSEAGAVVTADQTSGSRTFPVVRIAELQRARGAAVYMHHARRGRAEARTRSGEQQGARHVRSRPCIRAGAVFGGRAAQTLEAVESGQEGRDMLQHLAGLVLVDLE